MFLEGKLPEVEILACQVGGKGASISFAISSSILFFKLYFLAEDKKMQKNVFGR